MSFHIQKTVIFGVGLLGASIGLGLKAKRLCDDVIGIGRNITTLEKAYARGAIDRFGLEFSPDCYDSELIILCTPVQTALELLKAIAPKITSRVTITDVCSTKQEICQLARTIWGSESPFIGSHPLAGSEKFGPEYAQPNFYENSICLVEKNEVVKSESRRLVMDLWNELGATVIEIAPEEHDYYLAYTSHLPHVLASALAQITYDVGAQRLFIGGGFRDTTRIAESRPEIWKDIILTNRENVARSIKDFQRKLDEFLKLLEGNEHTSIFDFFQKGNEARKKLINP